MEILFENDDLIAVHKPEGIATIPERTRTSPSLIERLRSLVPGTLYVVHRLDKEVSGVLLVAKNAGAHRFLNDAFSQRRVGKTYRALVHGSLEETQGTIDRPIRQFGSGRMGVDAARGKPSVTVYAVLERFGEYTEVHAFPRTGRRHQIRVHCYAIGHPIVGDRQYGTHPVPEGVGRLMLHAEAIRLELPSGEELAVSSPLPASFTEALRVLRGGQPPAQEPIHTPPAHAR
jgi:RluA family pseudouridine synthase